MKAGVVIAAAGHGSRMRRGFNKQFIPLGDRPILVHTLQAFERMSVVEQVVIVTRNEDISRCRELCHSFGIDNVTHVVPGGETRQDSVRLGLDYITTEWVLVHDGARPFITETAVSDLLDGVKKHGAAVLAVPVKDTIKKVDDDLVISETPARDRLWAVQTPQAFRLSELKEAHAAAVREGLAVTDDAMLMEHMGFDVRVVRGEYLNLKITTPEDLLFAEAILHHFQKRVLGEKDDQSGTGV